MLKERNLEDCPFCKQFAAVRVEGQEYHCERCSAFWDQAEHERQLKMAKDREQGDYLDGMR